MKPIVAKQYPYTGDYYGYTVVTSADGTVSERRYVTFPEQVKLSLSVSLIGELLIESESKMQRDGRILNIRDKNGDEIYEGGDWIIVQTAPLLSAIGTKEGYKYRASILAGDI
jgi:hypothetical protein